jgi:hypothetical protein
VQAVTMKHILSFILIASVAAAQGLLVEEDPFIEKLFSNEFIVNNGANYSLNYLQKITNETGASIYPKLDNFNDENIKQQIRKNVLVIIDKFLSLTHDNMTDWQMERVANALAIQKIYQDDAIFNRRPLPKYYHTTYNNWVRAILTDMKIKYLPALYPGAWVATGFYDWLHFYIYYTPVFSFSSVLELPLSEVSIDSHYIRQVERDNFYGLGRLHDINMWKNNTDLIEWAVKTGVHEDMVNFIKTNFNFEKATFLLDRLTTIGQMVLEQQLIMIAQVYTNDRANALIMGSVWPNLYDSENSTCTFGQVVMYKYINIHFPYYLCLNSEEYLALHLAERKTKKLVKLTFRIRPINKYLPDLDITDMNMFAQMIADGNLLDQPPVSYEKLKRSVQRMQKHAHVVSYDEAIKMQAKMELNREEQVKKQMMVVRVRVLSKHYGGNHRDTTA